MTTILRSPGWSVYPGLTLYKNQFTFLSIKTPIPSPLSPFFTLTRKAILDHAFSHFLIFYNSVSQVMAHHLPKPLNYFITSLVLLSILKVILSGRPHKIVDSPSPSVNFSFDYLGVTWSGDWQKNCPENFCSEFFCFLCISISHMRATARQARLQTHVSCFFFYFRT